MLIEPHHDHASAEAAAGLVERNASPTVGHGRSLPFESPAARPQSARA
jgi:hypothetical protein